MKSKMLCVKDIAARLSVGVDVVHTHIRAGRLHARNVGCGVKRPRWRVTEEDFEAFVEGREVVLKPRKRRKSPVNVIEYFK